jgi:hypothetical protein
MSFFSGSLSAYTFLAEKNNAANNIKPKKRKVKEESGEVDKLFMITI